MIRVQPFFETQYSNRYRSAAAQQLLLLAYQRIPPSGSHVTGEAGSPPWRFSVVIRAEGANAIQWADEPGG